MRASALTGVAAAITALAVVLSGCGSDTKTATSSSSSTESSKSSSSKSSSRRRSPRSPSARRRPQARTRRSPPTSRRTASQETPIKLGDPGAPTIDLPVPDGWEPAGEDTPDWAYGAIVYTGPEAPSTRPSIVAHRLQADRERRPAEDHRPGARRAEQPAGLQADERGRDQHPRRLPGLPARRHLDTRTAPAKIVAQKTVVIPGRDGVYVLQLNADGLEDQGDIVGAATDVIDSQTTITP